MPWAVARVSAASSRQSSASARPAGRDRVAERGQAGVADRPGDDRGRDVGRLGAVGSRSASPSAGGAALHRARTASSRARTGRPGSVESSASARTASTSGDETRSSIAGGRNGIRRSSATDDRRQQLPVRPGEDRPSRRRRTASCRTRRPMRTVVVRRVRREHDRPPMLPGRRGSPSRTARRLCSTSRTARATTGRRAAVVHLEVDAPQAREGTRRARAPDGHRRAASRRSTGRRRRRRRPDWRARRGGAPSGAGHDRGPGPRRRAGARIGPAIAPAATASASQGADGPRDEVVEVEAAGLRDRALVRDEGPRDRARRPDRPRPRPHRRRRSSLSREIAVSSARHPAGPASGATSRRSAIRSTSGSTAARRRAGSRGQGHGTSAPEPRRPAADTPSGARALREPLAELLGRPLVERDRRDLAGRCRAGRDEPGDPGDEGGRSCRSPPEPRRGSGRAARSPRPAGPARGRARRSATDGCSGDATIGR